MATTKAAASALIKTYRRFPKELFRINAGTRIALRPKTFEPPSTSYYDIATANWNREEEEPAARPAGIYTEQRLPKQVRPEPTPEELLDDDVVPRALDPETYKGPNGMQMRMNTAYTRHYIKTEWKGKEPIVFLVQEGTPLPKDLILVREKPEGEEWSLEPAKRMTLQELNTRINDFLKENAVMITREEWAQAYRKATEPRGTAYPMPRDWRVSSLKTLTRNAQQDE